MKFLRLQLFLLLLIVHHAVWANPRTFKQAQAIAERQAQLMGISISQQARARSFDKVSSPVVSPEAMTASGATAYYVFPYGEDKGYVIVSGEDQMPEIVAYSDKGTLDEDHISEGCRDFLQAYKKVVEAISNGDDKALRLLSQKRGLMASSDYQQPTVSPLLGDIAWDQGTPYNNMCPYDENMQRRCLTGCVSTALAQVMRYWKYPSALLADIPAYISSQKYSIPQIDKGEEYDWDNMLPTYRGDANNYTQQQADAVAKLMMHCGAALNTSYGVSGSGTYLNTQSLIKYFGYDPDLITSVNRESVGFKKWCQLIDQELLAKRPVLYSGTSADGGHQYVCDGADGNGLYHINWGWGGGSNGYFDISILDPLYRGAGTGTGSGGFNAGCRIVIGVQPDNGQVDEPLVKSGDIFVLKEDRELNLIQTSRSSSSEAFSFSYYADYSNAQKNLFKGLLNLGVKAADGSYQPIAQSVSIDLHGVLDNGIYYYKTVKYDRIEYAFPLGVTVLYDIYSIDNGKTWQQCSLAWGAKSYELVATENTLTMVDEASFLRASLKAEFELTASQSCNFSYTVSNDNMHDYFGELDIYTSNSADVRPETPTLYDYVDIEAGGSTSHGFQLTPQESGDLYVWIYDVNHDKMLVDAQKFVVQDYVSPKLTLLSKSINLQDNVYELEKAYIYGHQVQLPVVDGDEAVVKYVFKNDGGTYRGDIPLGITAFSPDDNRVYPRITKSCCLEGNGEVTELEYRFKSSELKGCNSFVCSIRMDLLNVGDVDYSLIPNIYVSLLDKPGYVYTFDGTEMLGYFGEDASAISMGTVSNIGLHFTVGKGFITLTADKSQEVTIYNLAGQCVQRLMVQGGTSSTVNLPSGIYVLGNKKLIVR